MMATGKRREKPERLYHGLPVHHTEPMNVPYEKYTLWFAPEKLDHPVNQKQLQTIVERVTKPTVASEGGKPIKDKNFEYLKPPNWNQKTNPDAKIKNLETKFLGEKRVSPAEFEEIVKRLTTPTISHRVRSAPVPKILSKDY